MVVYGYWLRQYSNSQYPAHTASSAPPSALLSSPMALMASPGSPSLKSVRIRAVSLLPPHTSYLEISSNSGFLVLAGSWIAAPLLSGIVSTLLFLLVRRFIIDQVGKLTSHAANHHSPLASTHAAQPIISPTPYFDCTPPVSCSICSAIRHPWTLRVLRLSDRLVIISAADSLFPDNRSKVNRPCLRGEFWMINGLWLLGEVWILMMTAHLKIKQLLYHVPFVAYFQCCDISRNSFYKLELSPLFGL